MKREHIHLIITALCYTVSGVRLENSRKRMKKLSKYENSFYSDKMERAKEKYFYLEKQWYALEKEYLLLREKIKK